MPRLSSEAKWFIAGLIPTSILAGLHIYAGIAFRHARLYGPYTAVHRKTGTLFLASRLLSPDGH